MNDLRKAAEMMAYEVPLHELLEGVPEDARLVIDSEDGMSTRFIPVGHLCKRAAEALSQTEQEPVAWMGVDSWGNVTKFRTNPFGGGIPLYTAPPKRDWVGLSDEEIIDHFQTDVDTGSLLSFADGARYAEAKLKEKNT